MLDHSCQVQRHAYAERGHDLYGTPACGTRKLLQVEKLPLAMRESARPTYVLRLRAAGGDTDAIRALRGLLKTALRRFGLRANLDLRRADATVYLSAAVASGPKSRRWE